MNQPEQYDELVKRIKALIPDHPEINQMYHPKFLLYIPEFDCSDLTDLSLREAVYALRDAKKGE